MNGTTELDLWNLLQVSNMSNGIQFLGIAFLAWVGLRISSSIYNSGDSNMLVKVSGTVLVSLQKQGITIKISECWNPSMVFQLKLNLNIQTISLFDSLI